MPHRGVRAGYLVASVLCFAAGAIGSGGLIHFALGSPLRYQAAEGSIIGTLFLFVPFAVIGLLAAAVHANTSRIWSVTFFGLSICVLQAVYFRGYWAYEVAMMHSKWTAAAVSLGFLPFHSIPVIGVAAVVAFVICTWRASLPIEE